LQRLAQYGLFLTPLFHSFQLGCTPQGFLFQRVQYTYSPQKLKCGPLILVIASLVTFTTVLPRSEHVIAIAEIKVNSSPTSILVNPQTNKLYVSYEFSDKVSVIDTNSDRLTTTVKVGLGAHVLALDPINNNIYVTNEGSGTVSVIDGSTDTLTQTFKVGGRPAGIFVESVRPPSAYITNENQDMPVRHVDFYNNRTENICLVRLVRCMVGSFTPAPENAPTGLIYVANPDEGNVSVISGTSVNRTIHVGGVPADVAGDPTTNLVYVGSEPIYVIDGRTNRVVANISVPDGFSDADAPARLAINPSTHIIYVTDPLDNLVYWISATYRTSHVKSVPVLASVHTGPIPVGKYPTGVTVDNVSGLVYVANKGSGTVSVINGTTNNVVVGVNFNVQPTGSGDIDCNGKKFSTSEYARIDIGTPCTAERNGGSTFSFWSGDLVSNSNNKYKTTFYPSGYGTFTANFVPPSSLTIPPELLYGVILGPIVGAVIGWLLPFFRSPRPKSA
jgi:YVTN family beta-propeller protein